MDRSRLLKIIIITVGALLLLVVIWLVFFNSATRIVNRPQLTDTSVVPFNTINQPGGQQPGQGQPVDVTDTTTPVITTTETIGKFRKLSAGPVAGYTARSVKKTIQISAGGDASNPNQNVTTEVTVPVIRYISADNGFAYDAEIDETQVTRTQITKTFVANVAEAIFDGPNKVALRYANPQTEEIQTYDGVIPEKKPVPIICAAPISKELKRPSLDPEVKIVQTLLNYLDGSTAKVDGNFGMGTAAAVARFQTNNNLTVTSTTDEATRALMNQQCATIQAELEKKAKEPESLQGSFIGQNILQMISLQKGGVFMLSQTATGSKGTIRVLGKNRDVFNSPLTEWLPYEGGKDTLVVATKPSGLVNGFAYFFNTTTQVYKKIAGNILGLTVFPNSDASQVLIGGLIEGKGLRLGIYNAATKQTRTTSIATLPEKCGFKTTTLVLCGVPVKVPDALYPDDWYQNTVGFTDAIVRLDVITGAVATLEVPTEQHSFDYTFMSFDPSHRYLLFIDKKTGALWSYDTEL